MTIAPSDQILGDPYYRPPRAREFGVHPYEIRRVAARHSSDINLALSILFRAAERCGPNGEISKDTTLRDAVLKATAMRMIECAWSGEGWNAMAADDAIIEIRMALQASFPSTGQADGVGA